MFQDVDLVWLKDPFPYFVDLPGDIIFMDDGARTPRYTPFFVNSGESALCALLNADKLICVV